MKTTDHQLVIAVSSRALFDLEEEHKLFEDKGISAYRNYQLEHIDTPLNPGVAFAFIQRLLRLNELFEEEPFRVVVLSRNSPETGQRFFSSCRHYGLKISAGAFTSGQSTIPYLQAFGASLFLSANRDSVIKAIAHGQPAGLVIKGSEQNSDASHTDDGELRIAFDFDGVIIDDEAEKRYQQEGLEGFQRHEIDCRTTPHNPGPLSRLFEKLAHFQKLDAERGKNDPYYKPAIRVSIVTARGAPSEQRLITTLNGYGMSAAELFLLDGLPKSRILQALKPHIFFDDQLSHLQEASQSTPSVLIPFGVRNSESEPEAGVPSKA